MADRTFLAWPFFEEEHRKVARESQNWIRRNAVVLEHPPSEGLDEHCRKLVRSFGKRFLKHVVPYPFGGHKKRLDVRSLSLIREFLAYHSGLADFAFAMQGLGSGPISLFGSNALKKEYLPRVASGRMVAAFAISEPEAGSDVRSMQTTARRDGDQYV